MVESLIAGSRFGRFIYTRIAQINLALLKPNLQVYNTTNIRVVDMSVIPLHIGAHTQGKTILN